MTALLSVDSSRSPNNPSSPDGGSGSHQPYELLWGYEGAPLVTCAVRGRRDRTHATPNPPTQSTRQASLRSYGHDDEHKQWMVSDLSLW
ncbi:hypothetical protein B296_00036438 [Ensete ventricosum]|uniref:Uncharacterized protein n=1 Tax=Ensete ventricosum TaxID=4639 RepID=A0A426YQ15_ENSVE|nr:hypothetical protein B296_00036438 [Ensete ventricosum]